MAFGLALLGLDLGLELPRPFEPPLEAGAWSDQVTFFGVGLRLRLPELRAAASDDGLDAEEARDEPREEFREEGRDGRRVFGFGVADLLLCCCSSFAMSGESRRR